jgi:TPR repeat protein
MMLGLMFSSGQAPATRDYSEALKWFQKAADQGDTSAQLRTGLMFATGEGVPQDYVQAHKWLNLAAARERVNELRNYAANSRDLVAKQMTPAQVAEAQKLAREWKPAAGH